jgi:hypothetical protein
MRKRYIIPIIIFLLSLSFLLSCTLKPETEETTALETSKEEDAQQKSYLEESLAAGPVSFSENIFAFDYPSNWKIIDEQAINQLFKTSMEGSTRDSFDYIGGVYLGENWSEDIGEAVFSIYTVSDSSFNGTISNEQYDSIKNNYESQFGERLLSLNKIKFNSLDAVEIKTIGRSEQTQSWSINTIAEGEAYMLDLRAKRELYDDYEPIFIKIINSFKISK